MKSTVPSGAGLCQTTGNLVIREKNSMTCSNVAPLNAKRIDPEPADGGESGGDDSSAGVAAAGGAAEFGVSWPIAQDTHAHKNHTMNADQTLCRILHFSPPLLAGLN
jgi:hypothetical protein